MKARTGKECHMTTCKNYQAYSHWGSNVGSESLKECMECRYAHVSQYKKPEACP